MELNWYIKLKQLSTTDDKAKELLDTLASATPEEQAQAKETAKQYVESLSGADDTGDQQPENENNASPDTPDDKQTEEPEDITKLSEKELMKLRAKLIEKRKAHQKTKLASMSYDEKKAHNKKDFMYAIKIAKINERLQAMRKQERIAARKTTENNVLRKQTEFLNMLTHGISINNIIKKSELIRNIENLVAIMTPEFIEKCDKKYYGFRALWKRWYTKYVDNPEDKSNN